MSNIVLKIENVSKQYRLGLIGTGTISHDLNRWWHKIRGKEDPYIKIGDINHRDKKGGDYVWAINNINFEVNKGEVLGIIGKNGAGKSTILKLLSQVTNPTTGQIKVKGRIASLLEVGTGFHPELTGRENIYLNGAILGMVKAEISSKLDEIIDFSGVSKYIDTPVKRYSSGMMVRLGFAVAAHLEPEILVIDEVLAVGDAEFQKKCIGKMKEVASEGRTVIFVSHNMSSIRNICSKGIVLKNGEINFIGDVNNAILNYRNNDELNNKNIITDIDNNLSSYSTGEAKFQKAHILNNDNVTVNELFYQEKFIINTKLMVYKELNNISISYYIVNQYGEVVSSAYSYSDKKLLDFEKGLFNIDFKSSITLLPGNYALSFSIYHFFSGLCIDLIDFFYPFKVLRKSKGGDNEYPWSRVKGYIEMNNDWNINKDG